MRRFASHTAYLVRAMLPWRVVALVAAMAAARCLASLHLYITGTTLGGLVQQVLGGPGYDMFVELDTAMDWLLALMPPLAGLVLYSQRASGSLLVFSLHRYQSRMRWMAQQLAGLMVYTLLCTLVMALTILAVGALFGLRGLHVYGADAFGFLQKTYAPPLFSMLCYTLQSLMLLLAYLLVYVSVGEVGWGVLAYMLPVVWGILAGSNEENAGSIQVFVNWSIAARYAFSEGQFGVPMGWGLLRQGGILLALMAANVAAMRWVPLGSRRKAV